MNCHTVCVGSAFELGSASSDNLVEKIFTEAFFFFRQGRLEASRSARFHRNSDVRDASVFRRPENFDRFGGFGARNYRFDVDKISLKNVRVAGRNRFKTQRLGTFNICERDDDSRGGSERTFRRKNDVNGADQSKTRKCDSPAYERGAVDGDVRMRIISLTRSLKRDVLKHGASSFLRLLGRGVVQRRL